MKFNKNTIIVGILVLLVVVSVVQAFQLFNIKSNINSLGVTKIKTSTSNSATSSSKVPTNLQNLPGMVGGC